VGSKFPKLQKVKFRENFWNFYQNKMEISLPIFSNLSGSNCPRGVFFQIRIGPIFCRGGWGIFRKFWTGRKKPGPKIRKCSL